MEANKSPMKSFKQAVNALVFCAKRGHNQEEVGL